MSPRLIDGKETQIHYLIARMYQATDKAIEDALQCFRLYDVELARKVIANDENINRMQHEVEEECFSVIALHQPVASDLRDISSDTHIAIELERIADHAADIASIVMHMSEKADPAYIDSINDLGEKCRTMLARIMSAYTEKDVKLAQEIAAEDELVDSAEKQIIDNAIAQMCGDTEKNRLITHTIWIVHNIERIGDRVTNIAEQIVFMTTGNVVDLNR